VLCVDFAGRCTGKGDKGSGNVKNETCKGEKLNLKVAAHKTREKKGKVIVQDIA
jgi:hypothetical protein